MGPEPAVSLSVLAAVAAWPALSSFRLEWLAHALTLFCTLLPTMPLRAVFSSLHFPIPEAGCLPCRGCNPPLPSCTLPTLGFFLPCRSSHVTCLHRRAPCARSVF